MSTNRLSWAIRTGNRPIRLVNVSVCWRARTVVGTTTATCFPSWTALNAARTATSVLPKPTSPQTNRSIGIGFCMSSLIASMVTAWSGVSSNSKLASSSRCQIVSALKAKPWLALRLA